MDRVRQEHEPAGRVRRGADAAQRSPSTQRGTDASPPWLRPFRAAGNRALTGILAPVQRQGGGTAVDDATAAPAPDADAGAAPAAGDAAPLLDDAQVADARRYYASQPWRYTPAIVNQIRAALNLPEGGVDDALVLAVARWQSSEGAGDPALVVDGKAGPRTLPRIFRSGLNAPGQGQVFGEQVQSQVVDEWARLATAEQRRDRLVALVNERLAAAGVPAVTPAFDANPNNDGSFDFPTWRMLIGRGPLGGDTISLDDAKEIADTVYHEARHTEQWYRMAQLRAAQGLSAAAVATELGIPARIATQAKADPLVRGSMLAVIAQGWWDSVYGTGSQHREAVLTEVDRADTALKQARQRAQAHPTPANQAALDRAQARFDRAFAAYRNLPEENDAWATGPAAAAGVTSGSAPAPAPAGGAGAGAGGSGAAGAAPAGEGEGLPGAAGEPAGAPPQANGPAHGVLPEDNLPGGGA
jgi:hypothetical protein